MHRPGGRAYVVEARWSVVRTSADRLCRAGRDLLFFGIVRVFDLGVVRLDIGEQVEIVGGADFFRAGAVVGSSL